MDPLIWTQSSQESESLDTEDLGLLAGEASPKALFGEGGSIVCSNVITHVLKNSSEMMLDSDSFNFDPLKLQTLIITPLTEPFLTSNGDVRSTSVIGASRPNHSRIIDPSMNKDISSRDYFQSTVRSDVGKADKLDTAVQRSLSDNAAPLRIVEVIPKSIFPEIVEKSDSSDLVTSLTTC